MAADSSPEPDGEEKENEFVEVDPTGRFGRYNEVLGKGAFKTVYKAFDKGEGIEVAWNQVKRSNIPRSSDELDRVYSEVQLLKTLNHKNIIKFYNSWVDKQHDNINFITELFSSGTLRQYRKKHKNVDLRALKNWSRQILCGLIYLHSHDPPVIHRDLKCDNIFVNGNQGEVKIGDLGLAAILHHAHSAHSVIGTPEFMAPELYEEEYNELVDIYAFGMCLLELVTFEYPYAECSNAAQIYKKVTSGIKPASLAKVNEPGIRQFIEKCIANVSERLSARELLKDPFLQMSSENGILCQTMPLYHNGYDSDAVKLEPSTSGIDCTVEGQRKDVNTIFLKLRIADSSGQIHNIHFPFDIKADTSISVAAEMVAELDLTDQDVTTIADMIDIEIHVHFPGWAPVPLDEVHDNKSLSGKYFKTEHKFHTLPNDYQSFGNLAFERLPSGKKHMSGSPKGSSSGATAKQTQEFINIHDRDDVLEKEDTLKCSFHGVAPVNQEKESRHIIKCGCNNNGPNCPFFSSMVVQKHVKESTCPVSNEDELVTVSHNDTKRQLENGSNKFETVMLKLEKLLIKHQKEIDDLRKIHDIAIADLLRELPPELQSNAFSICRLKNQNEKVVRK